MTEAKWLIVATLGASGGIIAIIAWYLIHVYRELVRENARLENENANLAKRLMRIIVENNVVYGKHAAPDKKE